MSGLESMDRNMKILVVDDFSTMRRIVKNILGQLGFSNITEAEDGKQAWAAIEKEEQPFDLIVSDWNMPNMMGIELLKKVRAEDATKTIPFLMVTAESQKENVMEAVQAGVSNYIVKPFTAETMETKLSAIFSG